MTHYTSGILTDWVENPNRWPKDRIGTVHTVQGREAESVILVLGAPLASQTGARGWAGGRPNLLNVAVSRAQEVLYVIGNRDLWKKSGVFSELSDRIKLVQISENLASTQDLSICRNSKLRDAG